MPSDPTPGRSLVTRRAIVDIVRAATLGSYGVTGFAAGLRERLLAVLGIRQPGIRVSLGDRPDVDLELTVAYGLPVAEVARQVDSAVRYAVRRALGREVGRLTIHVGGLRYQPGAAPPPADPTAGPQTAPPVATPTRTPARRGAGSGRRRPPAPAASPTEGGVGGGPESGG